MPAERSFLCCYLKALFLVHHAIKPTGLTAIKSIVKGLFLSGFITASTLASAQDFILVQSTTSTENSGLYEYLLPKYTNKTGIIVKVVSVGTGQAIRNAQNCDGDLLIVHSTRDEEAFVKNGFGTKRYDLMYNDFVIVGPKQDPAGLKSSKSAAEAFRKIAITASRFASRGDNSGTHKAEQRLWAISGIETKDLNGSWYLETGLGMGATLNFTVQSDAYTLSDRATWLAFKNKVNHAIAYQGDPPMFNQYGAVPISKKHCPNAKAELAQSFVDWLLSSEGQTAIASFRRNGEQLFFPNAVR